MFQATIARRPASAGSGMKTASGAATSIAISTNPACAIPAIGVRAPERTLVAVRAIVPVTQKPPKIAAPIFATPCATSSMFERCRSPVIPSATIADSSDSIAPSRVKLAA